MLCDPVMENGEVKKVISLSDSRDCSKHWLISDTGLVDLLKRGRQPVIAASSWYMDVQGDQPTLNIERYKWSSLKLSISTTNIFLHCLHLIVRYIVVTEEQENRIGRPDPIKSHFYNYVRNEQMGGVNPADKFLPKRCSIFVNRCWVLIGRWSGARVVEAASQHLVDLWPRCAARLVSGATRS